VKLFKFLTLSVFVVIVVSGCSSTSIKSSGSDFLLKHPEKVVDSECTDSFIIGKKHYDKYRQLSGLDISNFFQTISSFEIAKEKCKSHEYEDDIIYSLANSYFYVGEYGEASRNYKIIADRFSSSSFNTGQNTAKKEHIFLESCGKDVYMENYRKAEVYELHKEFSSAIKQYVHANSSRCLELSKRSKKKSKLLKYMQE